MKKRLKQSNIFHIITLFVFVIIIFPQALHAAEVTFTVVSNPVVGDTATIVEVRIDPQDAPVNVVEGTIQIEDSENSITAVLVETGGSLLTLWPVKPAYDSSAKSISFTGGTRTTLTGEGLLFRMRIFSSSPETIKLSLSQVKTYLGDGNATLEPVAGHSISVAIEKSTPNPINPSSPDSIPPLIDKIEIGNDDEVYDGNNFIHVISTDNKSGIDRIEVTENGIVTEALDDTYVLQEQEDEPEVLVTAYDKAGNSTSLTFPKKNNWGMYFVLALLGILTWLYVHYKF